MDRGLFMSCGHDAALRFLERGLLCRCLRDGFGHGACHECGSRTCLQDDTRKDIPLFLHISGQSALGETLGRDADNIPDQAELLECANDVGGGIDLPPVHAVVGGAGEGVVVVVPTLSHGEEAHEEVIPALVGRDEFAAAVGVADRVHRPGDMVVEEHPDEATPDESVDASLESTEGVPDEEGDQEAQKGPNQEGLADKDHQLVLEEGAGVAGNVWGKIIQNPADMGMEEALQGAVRIPLLVGVGMVLDVGGRPVQGGALEGHRPADQEEATDPARSLETLMGQHPMIAYGDAEGTENVANQQQGQVDGSDETAPEAVNGKSGGQKRNPDYKLENNLVARGNGFIGHKLELYPRRSWMQGRDTPGGCPRAGVLGMGMGMGIGSRW